MPNLTKPAPRNKAGLPKKPHPDFPLFPHRNGQWAKKVRGRLHYFGVWSDPDAALNVWLEQKDDLLAGRAPREKRESDELLLKDLVNRFLTSKRHLLDTRELSLRSFQNYMRTCTRVIDHFGKFRLVDDLRTGDFEQLRVELAKTRGPVALGNEIRHVRILFKYGYDSGLIEKPVRFGPTFKLPSRRVLRHARYATGERLFEADEIRLMLDFLAGKSVVLSRVDEQTGKPTKLDGRKSPALRAMVLLGVNAGFGQTDVANLPRAALDLTNAWLRFPRPKTAIERRVPLWPETVQAIQAALDQRPEPREPEDADLVFVTKYGQRWVRVSDTEKQSWKDSVSTEFSKLLTELGIKRPKIAFYTLRRVLETIGGESRDQVAVDHIMGHSPPAHDMGDHYRERISDDRLRSVVQRVREWLFEDRITRVS